VLLEDRMPSSAGLLEQRELNARQRVKELREDAERIAAALAEAERAHERAVIATEEFAAALTEARKEDGPPPKGARPAAPGTIVPAWRSGLKPTLLAVDYQQIIGALDATGQAGAGSLSCRQIAVRLGWETSAAGVERVRSKAKRMAERGWLVREPDGRFRASVRPGGGS
jgi:hypothetical protein